MTSRNVYATLLEFKNYFTDRGGTVTADTTDDGVIDMLLESASRYIDDETARWFYPRIETRLYDTPGGAFSYARELYFDTDVLDIITFSNGDGSSISSTEYVLMPGNESVRYGIRLKQTSSIVWFPDSNGNYYDALGVKAIEGYHERYTTDAWKSAGTLGAAITDTTTLAFTMTGGHSVVVGKIYKIDNEIYIVDTVSTNTITPLQRGDNGSTAATHINGSMVYVWKPMETARNAVLELTNAQYKHRFGQSTSQTETITGGGIVVSPKLIPDMVTKFCMKYQRRVYQ